MNLDELTFDDRGLVPVIAHELGLQPPANTTPCAR